MVNQTPVTEGEQQLFFEQLRDGFATASDRTGEMLRTFRIGGQLIRLRFAGEALLPIICPGLANPCLGGESEPQFEVYLWDSKSSGVGLPPPPRPWRDFTERGNIWGLDSVRFRSAYQWGEGSVNVMDCDARKAVYWVPDAEHLPVWVMASPLRSILHWCMELAGRQLLHAAAVGFQGVGVLMPGRGGSGKSSTSLACLTAGMDFIADDYLALSLDPEPRAYRLYSTAKLEPRSLELYPDLARRCRTVYRQDFDKVVLFLDDACGDQLKESLSIKLVLKPEISGAGDCTFATISPQQIERELAAETLAHLPHTGPQTVEFLHRVAHELPRAKLRLSTDRSRIPAAVKQALSSHIPAPRPSYTAFDRRPFVSVIVHFHQQDPTELKALAAGLEAQGYPRTELVVMLSGPASAMKTDVAALPGLARCLCFDRPVSNAEAWNRGVRESFAEWMSFVQPSDRFMPGALADLIRAAQLDKATAWVDSPNKAGRLRGSLIRKQVFRESGLFSPDLFLQSREFESWRLRAIEKGYAGQTMEYSTLREPDPAAQNCVLLKPDFDYLLNELHRRRQKKNQ